MSILFVGSADLMRGTGRYNLAQGVVATAQGIGASLSGLAAGIAVDRLGFEAAFIGAGMLATPALAMLAFAMPETAADGTCAIPSASSLAHDDADVGRATR